MGVLQIVDPFNETALEVFARISALRDRLDGPPVSYFQVDSHNTHCDITAQLAHLMCESASVELWLSHSAANSMPLMGRLEN